MVLYSRPFDTSQDLWSYKSEVLMTPELSNTFQQCTWKAVTSIPTLHSQHYLSLFDWLKGFTFKYKRVKSVLKYKDLCRIGFHYS